MERVCALGPAAVILREKDLTPEEYGRLGEKVLKICRAFGVDCMYHTFAEEAVKAAVKDYYDRHGVSYDAAAFCTGDCGCCHGHE